MCDITSGTNDRSVKITVFHEGKFSLFQSKLKAVAAIKGFAEALEQGFESQFQDKENDTLSKRDDKEKKIGMKTKNTLAIHYLEDSFRNKEQLGYIEDARTTEWPSAIACKVWSTLKTELKPSHTLAT